MHRGCLALVDGDGLGEHYLDPEKPTFFRVPYYNFLIKLPYIISSYNSVKR